MDIIVTKGFIEPKFGKIRDIEQSIARMEGCVWDYLFGKNPDKSVDSKSAIGQKVEKNGVGVKRVRTAVLESLEVLQEQKEREERRVQDNQKRAERAAARLARLENKGVPRKIEGSTLVGVGVNGKNLLLSMCVCVD